MDVKVVRTDAKGRATLGVGYKGRKFCLVQLPRGQVELIPLSSDALREFSELGKRVTWKTVAEEKKSIDEALKREVSQRVRGH